MSPAELFQIANSIALTSWIALALSPLAPRLLGIFGGVGIPLVLSAGYTAIVLAHWMSGQGGFDSLESVGLSSQAENARHVREKRYALMNLWTTRISNFGHGQVCAQCRDGSGEGER